MVCATKPSRRTAVEDAKSWRHGRRSRDWWRNGRRRRLGPHCRRGGDGRRAASRAVRRPRRERRLGPRRGGRNLPAREVLAVFSKLSTYLGFADPPKPRTGSSSRRRHRGEDFVPKEEPRPSDEIVYKGCCRPTGLTGPAGINTPSLVLGQVRLLYCIRELFCSPGRRPCVSLPLFFSLE